MYRKKILIISFLLSVSGILYAENNAYTRPEDTAKNRLKEMIEHTERSIDICIHDFAELDIGENLEAARTRGVQVRVVVLGNHLKGTSGKSLIQKGIDVRFLKAPSAASGYRYFVLLDNRVLVTCVYNLEAYRHRDMGSAVRLDENPDRVNDYENTFSTMFADGDAAPSPVTGTRDIRLIFLFIIIFFVGLVFSMFGQGGGAFFVPIMIAFAMGAFPIFCR